MYDYQSNFLSVDQAGRLFAQLRQSVNWREERLHLYGRWITVPRLLAWCGDAGVNYRYAGADHHCHGWLPQLYWLRERIARVTGLNSNLVLLNCYRDGSDYMGWHTDAEPGLASRVASVSLGAPRRFLLRPAGRAHAGRRRSQRLDLDHGSLLVLDGAQPHSLPATRRPVGERINLTFRHLQAEPA
jgi:alkylated DNA repair dioxygenase AlkB